MNLLRRRHLLPIIIHIDIRNVLLLTVVGPEALAYVAERRHVLLETVLIVHLILMLDRLSGQGIRLRGLSADAHQIRDGVMLSRSSKLKAQQRRAGIALPRYGATQLVTQSVEKAFLRNLRLHGLL